MIEKINEYYKTEKEKQELKERIIKRYGVPKVKKNPISKVRSVIEDIAENRKSMLLSFYERYLKVSDKN